MDDVLDLLTSESVGTAGTNLFGGIYPDAPASLMGVVETGGLPYTYTMSTDPVLERPRVQVMVRSTEYAVGRAWAQQAQNALDALRSRLINGVRYHWMQAVAPPSFIGLDDNQRYLFSLNFDIARDRSGTS